MIANNYFTDNEDLLLYFNELIDWDEIVQATETGADGTPFADAKEYAETENENLAFAPSSTEEAVEFYRATLESLGDLSGNLVAQRAQKMDWTGLKHENGKVTFPPEMVECYEAFKDAGIIPYMIHRRYGGLGMPAVIAAMYTEIVTRADTAFMMALGLLNLANTIVRYGTEEQKQTYVTRMAAGESLGAMALTEPNYGSDLSSVKTKAVKQEDGTYRLFGTKRFISQGCGLGEYPCTLLTLARTGGPDSGARGLSLFIVKSEDVEIAGIEKKMGLHCSPTCEVVYDNSPGELIGSEGYGLTRYTLQMMNAARAAVAALGAAIGSAAYYEAKKYAHEREQFGKNIVNIPAVKRMLDRMERENMAIRLLTGEAARAVDNYMHRTMVMERAGISERDIKKNDDLKYWERIATMFTPISKYYGSEMGITLASDAVQIHGGAGYTEEYDVARIYRDSRINTIYEGTTQLQVVGAIGQITAGMSEKGNFRKYFENELAKFSASEQVQQEWDQLEEAVSIFKEIEDSEIRDGVAFEVVEITARLMCGMLLERGASRVDGENRDRLLRYAGAYHTDSGAIILGNLYKLKAAKARTGTAPQTAAV